MLKISHIIAAVVAITAVLFVVPASADLVAAGGDSRLFVAYMNDPASDIDCDYNNSGMHSLSSNGLELYSGADLSGKRFYVYSSRNPISGFDNKAQSL